MTLTTWQIISMPVALVTFAMIFSIMFLNLNGPRIEIEGKPYIVDTGWWHVQFACFPLALFASMPLLVFSMLVWLETLDPRPVAYLILAASAALTPTLVGLAFYAHRKHAARMPALAWAMREAELAEEARLRAMPNKELLEQALAYGKNRYLSEIARRLG